jgi:hypothetical protein
VRNRLNRAAEKKIPLSAFNGEFFSVRLQTSSSRLSRFCFFFTRVIIVLRATSIPLAEINIF